MHAKNVPWVFPFVVLISLALLNVVNGTCSIKFLGRTGNKIYFTSSSTGNWTNSKIFCENLNIKLGTIETEAEHNFLKASYKSSIFNGWYWTAARDARTPKQLVWDSTKGLLLESLKFVSNVTWALTNNDFLTCGAFYIEQAWSGMIFVPCSRAGGHVLCEAH